MAADSIKEVVELSATLFEIRGSETLKLDSNDAGIKRAWVAALNEYIAMKKLHTELMAKVHGIELKINDEIKIKSAN